MKFYEKFRSVPTEACKDIGAGKLKGFTDINPMWRIKMLTDQFGPCGFGWYIEEAKYWTESVGNEIAVLCEVKLKVKHPESGEWSAPIIGIGGSKLAGKGKGEGIDDEAHKMAYTDAISISCKNLGMAADIYYKNDRTKYNTIVDAPKAKASAPAKEEKPAQTTEEKPVKQKPTFDSSHPKWQEALDKMVAGQGSIKALQSTFIIPANVEEEIKNYLKQHIKN